MKFEKFVEIRGALEAPIDDVYLQKGKEGYYYDFTIDGNNYSVHFDGPFAWGRENEDNKWYVHFTGPNKYALVHSENPMKVYTHVIKAFRKLVELVNPDALEFSGYSNEQDIMYDKFYRLYLRKYYTHVNDFLYVRNDLMKKSYGNDFSATSYSNQIDMEKKEKLAARQKRIYPVAKPKYRRGDLLPNGGLYVGTSPNGVDWVAYNPQDYGKMVKNFDATYAPSWTSVPG